MFALLIRLFAWAIGLAVIAGTAALCYLALTGPAPQPQAKAVVEARKCPPDISIPPRADGAPVDDILGVRPGMSLRDLEETVKCRSEANVVEAGDDPRARGGGPARLFIHAQEGEEHAWYALYGPASSPQVAAMWRERFYDAGQGPTMEETQAALTDIYGEPHEVKTSRGARELLWLYDPEGKPLRVKPKTNSDLEANVRYYAAAITAAKCAGHVRLDPASAPSFGQECGLGIRADIATGLGKEAKVARYRLALVDQPTLARLVPSAPADSAR